MPIRVGVGCQLIQHIDSYLQEGNKMRPLAVVALVTVVCLMPFKDFQKYT